MEIFESGKMVTICAPMVRYSKLPFRLLVRKYGTDLAYTPMIMADSFARSPVARDNEFTTNPLDRPLIAQFGANNAKDFADATELIHPYVDGIDLNCGCPQTWAMSGGYGAQLIRNPELIADMISQAKARTSKPISIKIRVHHDLKQTVELVKRAEKVGVSWITVHGRTSDQPSSSPPNYEAIKLAKESVTVPVVANGNIFTLEEAKKVRELTGVDGVMSARGMMQNPAMFAGYDITPIECVQDFVNLSMSIGSTAQIFQGHISHMLDHHLTRQDERFLNTLNTTSSILDFLNERFGITCSV